MVKAIKLRMAGETVLAKVESRDLIYWVDPRKGLFVGGIQGDGSGGQAESWLLLDLELPKRLFGVADWESRLVGESVVFNVQKRRIQVAAPPIGSAVDRGYHSREGPQVLRCLASPSLVVSEVVASPLPFL